MRSLGRQGIEVHAAPFDFSAPALSSRYISAVHWLPYYQGDGEEWLSAIKTLFQAQSYDLVIPCDERALLPLARHRNELSGWSRLALPDEPALEVFYDKQQTRELARSLDVPVAPGRLIADGDTVREIVAETGLPVVVKPRRSYSPGDLYSRGRVRIAADAASLEEILPSVRGGDYFFEGFFPGQGVGLSILASDGRLLQAFQHHRVHERGGSGYYRVSAPLSPPLLAAVEAILKATDYTGVAMFEFKLNLASGKWILLEVNARPWGSLPLPVGLGVDFPYDWYRLLVDGVEVPRHSYRVGIHARNFIPDLQATLAEAAERWKRPGALLGHLARTFWEWRHLLSGREFHDVFVVDDVRPAFSEFGCVLREVLGRVISPRLSVVRGWLRQRDRHRLRRTLRRAKSGRFSIVFVCQGNICRSPLAALALTRQLALEPVQPPGLTVDSAGMLPLDGKESPAAAILAAGQIGLDLASHRSHHFSRDIAGKTDLVVLFDEKNLHWLRIRYPDLAASVVFLGSFAEEPSAAIEIADPDGKDIATFERTYAQIERAVAGLVSALCLTQAD